MIAELKKNFNDVDKSIFKAAANVNMNSILGWEKDGEKYSFLDPETPKSKKQNKIVYAVNTKYINIQWRCYYG